MKLPALAAWAIGMLCGAPAFGLPTSCPEPRLVELNAIADGWKSYTPPNAYDKPAIQFQNMRVNPNNLWCQYEVGGGTVRLLNVTSCQPSTGNWEEKGLARVCTAKEAGACVAECPEAKR